MNIIAFLLVGLIAGYLAGKIVEGHGFGTLGDIVVGIVGAFIGGFIAPHVIGDGAVDAPKIGQVQTVRCRPR